MSTLIEYIGCPICGKTSPTKTGSFKIGDPAELGWIQIRECRGKKGFCTIETKLLRDNIKDYQKFADELVDFCSGVLMVVMEENLPIHKPTFILKYEDLDRQLHEGIPEIENTAIELDDLQRENATLLAKLQRANENLDEYRLIRDDLIRKNEDLITKLNSTTHREESHTFKTDDQTREIRILKRQLKDKNRIIQQYEDNSLI